MTTPAYQDGYNHIRLKKIEDLPDLAILERAITDCQEMGWSYLSAYFEGERDALKEINN